MLISGKSLIPAVPSREKIVDTLASKEDSGESHHLHSRKCHFRVSLNLGTRGYAYVESRVYLMKFA